jgi:hypothetical protein
MAWLAWARSCEDAEVRRWRVEKGTPFGQKGNRKRKGLVRLRETEEGTSQGRDGDPRFLDTIANCIEKRMRIFGLVKPPNLNVQQNHVSVDWGPMFIAERPTKDPVEERIEQLLNERKITEREIVEADGDSGELKRREEPLVGSGGSVGQARLPSLVKKLD